MLVTRGVYVVSSQVPILLLKEGSTETKDKDAQRKTSIFESLKNYK